MMEITKREIERNLTEVIVPDFGAMRFHEYVCRLDDVFTVELIGVAHNPHHVTVYTNSVTNVRAAMDGETWSMSRQIAIDEIYNMVN